MALSTIVSVAAASLALYVAVLCVRFARAPGWEEQRWFAVVAVGGGLYCALEPCFTPPLGPRWSTLASSAQMLAAGVCVAGWLRYAGALVRQGPSRWATFSWVLPLVLGALGLVPGLFFTEPVLHRHFLLFGVTYFDVNVTPAGMAASAALCGALVLVFVRLFRAWRRGVPGLGATTLASVVMVVTATSDTLVGVRLVSGPYLMSFGFLVPIVLVGVALTGRFVEEVRALQKLEDSLEAFIAERTHELIATQKALAQAEKLAALGQLAGGVAHEINNPAAAVIANLRYLIDGARSGAPPDDALDALQESLASMGRISQVVRQLLITGRMSAGTAPQLAPVELIGAVEEGIRLARARCGEKGEVVNEVPLQLSALAQEQALVQIFSNLVSNALESAAGGRAVKVRVRAAPEGEAVKVTVEDDGAGMSEETLGHLFEPFFSTKPFGHGTGLGLSVSKGLVAGLGGALRFTSELGKGTTAHLELRHAAPRAEPLAPPEAPAAVPAGPLPRVLLIDDDPGVRDAYRRELGRHFQLTITEGVSLAAAKLAHDAGFDLVLCDLMMPEGGGEAFWELVTQKWPALAPKVVFISGGATDERSRAFVEKQRQPVLTKPIEPSRLVELARTLGHS